MTEYSFGHPIIIYENVFTKTADLIETFRALVWGLKASFSHYNELSWWFIVCGCSFRE
jgi:hypothetical protein